MQQPPVVPQKTPEPLAVSPGIPPRSIMIPSLGISANVAEVSTTYDAKGNLIWQTVPFLVGHYAGSANPGQAGNTIFSGHLTSLHSGSVFKRLPEITIGAGVIVVAGDTNYLYRVVDKRVVEPSDLGPLQSTSEATATLITCVPDGIYNQRLVVTAKLVNLPAAAVGTR